MFWKLWKYEVKCSYRNYALMYGILLLASFFINAKDSFVNAIIMMIYGVMIVVTLIMTIVIIVRTYLQSMFQRPSYLTMTLPVSSKMLMAVKIINASLWFLLSYVVIILSAIILGARVSGLEFSILAETFSKALQALDLNIFLLITNVTIGFISSIALIYAILNFTHSCYIRKYRGIIAVAIFIVFNILTSFISEYVLGGVGGDLGMGNLLVFNAGPSSAGLNVDFQLSMSVSIIENLVLIMICYFGASYLLDHKLEIE